VDEVRASLSCIADLIDRVASLDSVASLGGYPVPNPADGGVGIAEGWRGVVVHRVELDTQGRISRVKVVDPSFLNWPALPVSLADTIVPDFPLANKSFNLSYAGNDL
jgi:Ni,Fe-hydrogenase III large subunit